MNKRNPATAEKWIVSVIWLETTPNHHVGTQVTRHGQEVPWAQTERPVTYEFGRVHTFSNRDDAERFASATRYAPPVWLPAGAHGIEVSKPIQQSTGLWAK